MLPRGFLLCAGLLVSEYFPQKLVICGLKPYLPVYSSLIGPFSKWRGSVLFTQDSERGGKAKGSVPRFRPALTCPA